MLHKYQMTVSIAWMTPSEVCMSNSFTIAVPDPLFTVTLSLGEREIIDADWLSLQPVFGIWYLKPVDVVETARGADTSPASRFKVLRTRRNPHLPLKDCSGSIRQKTYSRPCNYVTEQHIAKWFRILKNKLDHEIWLIWREFIYSPPKVYQLSPPAVSQRPSLSGQRQWRVARGWCRWGRRQWWRRARWRSGCRWRAPPPWWATLRQGRTVSSQGHGLKGAGVQHLLHVQQLLHQVQILLLLLLGCNFSSGCNTSASRWNFSIVSISALVHMSPERYENFPGCKTFGHLSCGFTKDWPFDERNCKGSTKCHSDAWQGTQSVLQ